MLIASKTVNILTAQEGLSTLRSALSSEQREDHGGYSNNFLMDNLSFV